MAPVVDLDHDLLCLGILPELHGLGNRLSSHLCATAQSRDLFPA